MQLGPFCQEEEGVEIGGDAVNSEGEELQVDQDVAVDGVQQTVGEVIPFATGNTTIDRPRSFIIDDSVDQAPAVFCATKLLKATGPDALPRQRVSAIAIRERGTTKFSKIIRFAHNLPSSRRGR